MKPTAVAGWSMVTPFGAEEATIEALFEGRSAFSCLQSKWTLRNDLAAVIESGPGSTPSARDRQRDLAVHVAQNVIDAHSIELEERCVFVFATSFGHLADDPGEDSMSTWARDCLARLGHGADPIIVASGCSSGSDALGLAAAMLDAGSANSAIVIAADIVTPAKRIAHSALGTMSAGMARPFDKHRDGMLLGEAAAAVVLMRPEHCPGRRGELLGVGASNDATGLAAPDRSGRSIRLSLARALDAASLGPDDLALYLAHGTGTELNDDVEARIVSELFAGNEALALVGTKGALGHSLGACGLVEFILLLEMLERRCAPPTVGLEDPISCVSRRVTQGEPRPLAGDCGVSVTLGFGGFNTALVARAA